MLLFKRCFAGGFIYAILMFPSLSLAEINNMQNKSTGLNTQTVLDCSSIDDYDENYASYKSYMPDRKYVDFYDGFAHGFYQLLHHQDKIYAAFGGAHEFATGKGKTVAGTIPGFLVVLNANTMQLEKKIPLPFHAFALALDSKTNHILVTHTHSGTFSLVDLNNDQVKCMKRSEPFRLRNVRSDNQGNFYINSYIGLTQPGVAAKTRIDKYNSLGQKVNDFQVEVPELNFPLSIDLENNRILTGSKNIKSIDLTNQKVEQLTNLENVNFLNTAVLTNGNIVATNFGDYNTFGEPSIYMKNLTSGKTETLYVGSGGIEVKQLGNLIFVTNYKSQTVSVIKLANNDQSLTKAQFFNIEFAGAPNSIDVREYKDKIELFITPKWETSDGYFGYMDMSADLKNTIAKVTLDKNYNNDLQKLAQSCEVMYFNLENEKVTATKKCQILPAKDVLRNDQEKAYGRYFSAISGKNLATKYLTQVIENLKLAQQQKNIGDIKKYTEQLKAVEGLVDYHNKFFQQSKKMYEDFKQKR